MAHKVDLEIAGVIENMSGFTTPSGERFAIFGEGGGNELADELDVPLLGKVPLTMPLREQADGGTAARDRGPRRPRRTGDPPGGTRPDRDGARCAADAPARRGRRLRSRAGREPETRGHVAADGLSTGRRATSDMPVPQPQAVGLRAWRCQSGPATDALDKRVPPERIVFRNASNGEQQEERAGRQPTASPDRRRATNGVVEFDERRAKMERLRAEGIDPYPPVTLWGRRTRIAEVLAAHDPAELDAGRAPRLRYLVAGRLISRRGHGKTAFLDLRDLSGSIQVVLRVDSLGQETYDRILNLDIGDIVGVDGCVYVTQRGQLALAAIECTLLTKTLRPPPDKHHGLGDTGTRYRYRELDLIANEETRELFVTRNKIVLAIREWLAERNFVEVETPALQSLAGGAGSRPFTTHHNALDRDLYLRISVELFLNRCIVGGMENVYDMGKVFRNEGISPQAHARVHDHRVHVRLLRLQRRRDRDRRNVPRRRPEGARTHDRSNATARRSTSQSRGGGSRCAS